MKLNFPNILVLVRLALVPVIVILLLIPSGQYEFMGINYY